MESKYSIRDLEHLTGVKAHTIRVWEQRYEIVTPQRTDTNIRYYKDQDLKRLLNVAVLVHGGMKISKVAEMSDAERNALVLDASKYQGNHESQINGLKIAMLEFNENLFERILTNSMATIGSEQTFSKIIGGLIQQIGILWQTNTISVAHEHFASNLIRQKLYVAIDDVMGTMQTAGEKTYLLYLPADELHELGLLYLSYLLQNAGNRVIYLGQSVPLEYLFEVMNQIHVDSLVSIFTTYPYKDDTLKYFDAASKLLGDRKVDWVVGGRQLTDLDLSGIDKRFTVKSDVMSIKDHLFANVEARRV
ncbi:MAG: MerR family transcriptional regulator [Flavobacteriia bacterium]|nr:MerR family transcriptional regulator [Flavobacteriia bacterium]